MSKKRKNYERKVRRHRNHMDTTPTAPQSQPDVADASAADTEAVSAKAVATKIPTLAAVKQEFPSAEDFLTKLVNEKFRMAAEDSFSKKSKTDTVNAKMIYLVGLFDSQEKMGLLAAKSLILHAGFELVKTSLEIEALKVKLDETDELAAEVLAAMDKQEETPVLEMPAEHNDGGAEAPDKSGQSINNDGAQTTVGRGDNDDMARSIAMLSSVFAGGSSDEPEAEQGATHGSQAAVQKYEPRSVLAARPSAIGADNESGSELGNEEGDFDFVLLEPDSPRKTY